MLATKVIEPAARLLVDRSRSDLRDPTQGRPVRVYDWAPDAPAGTPLVVVSHGTGGSGRDMGWLARPLAAAGLRVLSLDHHGNNHVDGYHPEGFLLVWERPRDITFLLDAVWDELRPSAVGVAGFSLGGYTAAALVGARVDAPLVASVLAGDVPLPPIEEMPDALEQLRARHSPDELAHAAAGAGVQLRDPRVAAAFLVAPGLGALLTPRSLASVPVPVEVRWGDADTTNPFERDVRPLLDHLPAAHGLEVGPGVGHHDFIEPLTPDRPRARERVGSEAVAFFTEQLLVGADRSGA
ncbi:alpha/beta hydrolase family protein [Nocardioides sp. MAHUQ-72]|uniref:alpha/beta hydrolase family protein n=1 Tax=unclassified Nocardioides TaxID=2615069 RepID=UPI0036095F6F